MAILNQFSVQTDALYLPHEKLGGANPWPPLDTRYVPFGVTCAVLAIQLLHVAIVGIRSFFVGSVASIKDTEERDDTTGHIVVEDREERTSTSQKLKAYIDGCGGYEIFWFILARLVGCIILFHLTVKAASSCQAKNWKEWPDYVVDCPEYLLLVPYAYSILLSVISLVSKKWRTSASRYNVVILFAMLAVYTYRDLWPLATYDKQPADLVEGKLLWVKLGVLILTAAFIPLCIPKVYVPIDPKNPMITVNPEQTCSLLSYLTYTYLDNIILKGYRVPHLPVSELPPLPDYDRATHLKFRGSKYLDSFGGAKPGHIFFGMVKTFYKELSIILVSMILVSLTMFVSPIGINRVLNYLETGGKGATIRPWFWILWLFFGPLSSSLVSNWSFFVSQATMIRVEALLTELIFEHTLRIRLKAETPENASNSGTLTPKSGTETTKRDGTDTSRENASSSAHSQASTAVASEGRGTAASETSTVVSPPEDDTSDSVVKGKSKPKAEQSVDEKNTRGASNFTGKLNNLVTSDLSAVSQARDWMMICFSIPLIITLSMVFLYQFLGWSAFVFLFTTIALMGIPGYVSTLLSKTQKETMKATDARVQAVTETINILRMVKLFGWEGQMEKRIYDKREEELRLLRKQKILNISNGLMGYFIPTLTMVLTYATYVIVMKGNLTPSKIFSTMVVFETVRMSFQRIIWQANIVIQGKVSLDRIGDFLQKSELLDCYTAKLDTSAQHQITPAVSDVEVANPEIGFRNAVFMWSKSDADDEEISKRRFILRIDNELLFRRGSINLIVGPTGSGKTSVLMALLGEMHFIPTDSDSWYNLPREGGIAYAAQESWVLNDTIRNNIVFESPYNEVRYKKGMLKKQYLRDPSDTHSVITQCALERDLELFEAGDQTEVGEKGLTLSGGQKARITLARAIYSTADTLLLDDIFAALDVHTSAWIIENCLKGDLVQGRTVLLITHNVALASPVADFIVSVGRDGKITTQGVDISTAMSHDAALAMEMEKNKEAHEIAKQDIQAPVEPSSHKLVLAEEVAQGRVTARTIKLLLKSLGGTHPYMFFATFVGSFAFTEVSMTFQVWFLGYWGSQYETRDPSEVPAALYVLGYIALFTMSTVLFTSAYVFYIYGNIRAARRINGLLIDSILRSTLRWLDETPTGRIITRCTQDIRAVDSVIPQYLLMVQDSVNVLITKLFAIILFTPLFVFPGLVFAAFGVFIGNVFQKAQLSVKRESSNAKAPVLSHFNAAVQGLVSIRAYGAQQTFIRQSINKLNGYTHLTRTTLSLNRWISFRIDTLGALFSSALATYLVYGPRTASSTAGFTLNMSVEFTMAILFFVRIFNEFEVQANSLERIQGYLDIDHEPKATEAGKPPAYWPSTGDLRVEKLSARYSHSGPRVLHEVSFHLQSGERIGIVGRTGSGKSSLTLALLRGIITEGNVYYDGIPTDTLNLDALRSNITIIPQIPELLSGTLRQNLDPLQLEDDATLNDALRSAGLFTLQEDDDQARLTLDTDIAGGGSNLSVGQRQILALARAMIRGSKILILDEATSAIDYKTDAIIQKTLREQLPKDVTVITVAHRLQTVMDSDKILVLDEGRIVEFDQPKNLLKKEKGFLRSLVDGSGDKTLLYDLASAL